jgi:CBS domain-containing protein
LTAEQDAVLATKVMRSSLATIRPTTSLLEATRLLLETNQRALPVLDDRGNLLGILSEEDLLHREELGVKPPAGNWLEEVLGIEEDSPSRNRMRTFSIAAIMTPDPLSVDEHASVNDVIAIMDGRKVAQVPVVRGRKVIGIVSRFELLAALEHKLRPDGTHASPNVT